jgi:hypothetical protein
MKKKQLLKKLIYHYEWCIEYLPKKNWDKFLEKYSVNQGVCFLAFDFYGVKIYYKDWMKKYIPSNFMCVWAPYPRLRDLREDALRYLQVRLDNLRKELHQVTTKA